MNFRKQRKLIISLIKDDLINSKLANGLSDMGLKGDDYLLHLSDTIFKLVGIKDTLHNEFIYETYLEMTARAKYIDITQGHDSLNNLVEEIYSYLLNENRNVD